MNSPFSKKVTITISPDTWERIKDSAPLRKRSKFIDNALQVYLVELKKRALRKQLKKEALESAKEGLRVVKEWEHLDREVWRKIK